MSRIPFHALGGIDVEQFVDDVFNGDAVDWEGDPALLLERQEQERGVNCFGVSFDPDPDVEVELDFE